MSRFFDSLIALWIVFVAVVYFGAPFAPGLWLYEPTVLIKVYIGMLFISVVAACLRWLGRSEQKQEANTRPFRRR